MIINVVIVAIIMFGVYTNLKSKIVIDASTSVNQRRSLSKILAYIIR